MGTALACRLGLFVTYFILVASVGREKRLVLHSDTDVATEVIKLRAEVANLTKNLANLTAFIQNVEYGSVYVRWGRTTCSGAGNHLVYKGYMAGSEYTEKGNGANHLCLPDDPTWAKYDDANQANWRAYIYGTEFDENGDVIFGKHVRDEDIPCVVCKTPRVSVMIPARADCYQGWNLEYTGYLMAGWHDHTKNDYVCVDADPDFIVRGGSSTNGNLLYLVEGICGTLVCPPYFNYRELACCVCSK